MQPSFCTKCGHTLREGDKFCRKCGTQVRRAAATAPAQKAPSGSDYAGLEKPEGTVFLGDLNRANHRGSSVRKASISLSLNEMLEGCSKVVDFGTGRRYELNIPPGLKPNSTITVKSPSLIDEATGMPCRIELTVLLG